MPVGSCQWQTWNWQWAEYWFQRKYKADFRWVPQGFLFTEKPHMQSTSLCTAQHGKTHFSRACTLAFVWRYQGYCFSPWGICLAGGGHFCVLFSILRWLLKTGMNLFTSSYIKVTLENGYCWWEFKDCSETFGWRLFMWSKSFTLAKSSHSSMWQNAVQGLIFGNRTVIKSFLESETMRVYCYFPLYWLYWFGFTECNRIHFAYQQVCQQSLAGITYVISALHFTSQA